MKLVSHLFTLFAFAALSSFGATFERLDFDELTRRADAIFVGTVVGATPNLTARGQIVTDFAFADVEPVKGATPSSRASVRMLGGNVRGESLAVPGAPTFTVGQRYVVFIEGNGRVMFPTLGGPQGIYRVTVDPVSKSETVQDYGGRPLTALPGGSALVARPKDAVPGVEYEAPPTGMTKDAFVAQIRARLGASR